MNEMKVEKLGIEVYLFQRFEDQIHCQKNKISKEITKLK